MRELILGALVLLGASDIRAQDMVNGDGWEGFPMVDYRGGDSQFKRKGIGILVLTDSTIAFYNCLGDVCQPNKKKEYFESKGLIWEHSLRSVTDVSSSSSNKGPSITGRVMFGVLATDRNEEYFGFTYETDKTAESPVFKVPKTFSGAMEAKVKFRMKKLGVVTPQK